MKTLTKEEIFAEIEFSARNTTLNEWDYKKLVYNAMQSYSDQENANLKAISLKQAELIDWLEMRLNDLDSFDKYNQIRAELKELTL